MSHLPKVGTNISSVLKYDKQRLRLSCALSSIFKKAAQIALLQGRNDWVEWDEELQGQLEMINLDVILTDLLL